MPMVSHPKHHQTHPSPHTTRSNNEICLIGTAIRAATVDTATPAARVRAVSSVLVLPGSLRVETAHGGAGGIQIRRAGIMRGAAVLRAV